VRKIGCYLGSSEKAEESNLQAKSDKWARRSIGRDEAEIARLQQQTRLGRKKLPKGKENKVL